MTIVKFGALCSFADNSRNLRERASPARLLPRVRDILARYCYRNLVGVIGQELNAGAPADVTTSLGEGVRIIVLMHVL